MCSKIIKYCQLFINLLLSLYRQRTLPMRYREQHSRKQQPLIRRNMSISALTNVPNKAHLICKRTTHNNGVEYTNKHTLSYTYTYYLWHSHTNRSNCAMSEVLQIRSHVWGIEKSWKMPLPLSEFFVFMNVKVCSDLLTGRSHNSAQAVTHHPSPITHHRPQALSLKQGQSAWLIPPICKCCFGDPRVSSQCLLDESCNY